MSKLDEALRSLASDVDGKSARADETRDVIFRRTRPRPNKFRHLTLLAAAILFIGTAAWAGATGRIRALVTALTSPSHEEVESQGQGKKPPTIASSGSLRPAEKEEPSPVQSATIAPAESTSLPSAARPREVPPKPPPKAVPPPSSEELDAYEKAHRAHFDRNPTALSLWDAYLQKYPGGKWEPEVRYNRALFLLRSGDKSAAKAALEPFARGDFGAYRQKEASALLQSLREGGKH